MPENKAVKSKAKSAVIRSGIEGVLKRWPPSIGDQVSEGQIIGEVTTIGGRRHKICAPCTGFVKTSEVSEGDRIEATTILCRVGPTSSARATQATKLPAASPKKAKTPSKKAKTTADKKLPDPKRVLTTQDQEAVQANAILQGNGTQEKRRGALDLLKQLAEEGSAVAQYHLGEWLYAGTEEDEKERGLRYHTSAARGGYLRSLVTIQYHEDPLLQTYDFLHDPTSLGLPASIRDLVDASRFIRIALLVEGLTRGVTGYRKLIADEVLAQINATSCLSQSTLTSHVVSVAYELLRDYYDAVRALAGPGSRTALEENEALLAGFTSWGDRKARAHIADKTGVMALPEELAPFTDRETARQLPTIAIQPPDVDAGRLIELVGSLGPIDEEYSGSGVDLLVGSMWFAAVVDLGYRPESAGLVSIDLVNGYRKLGGRDGLLSYMARLSSNFGSVRYVGAWKSAAPGEHHNHYGVMNTASSTREVILLDLKSSRAEVRIEKSGVMNINVFRGSKSRTEYETIVSTVSRFALTGNEQAAFLALYNQKKTQTTNNNEKKEAAPMQKSSSTEEIKDFSFRELYPLNNFIAMERIGSGMRLGCIFDRAKELAPRAIDDWINRLRRNLIPQSAVTPRFEFPNPPNWNFSNWSKKP